MRPTRPEPPLPFPVLRHSRLPVSNIVLTRLGNQLIGSIVVFVQGQWPAQDKVIADLESADVKEWMKELDGWDIPDFAPTVDGSCKGDPAAAADAANRGWWTCGHYTRDTDVVACPEKMTWGTSFDDGPSAFTE
jgi:hypothetical protein